MITIQEMNDRRKTIGASEVHFLRNFDTLTAQQLWEEKMGLITHQELEGDSIESGNILEEQCLDFYEQKINEKVYRNEKIKHPTIEGFVVSLDGRTNKPIENKCINQNVFDKWKAKSTYNAIDIEGNKYNIPTAYYLQLQAQMECLGTKEASLLANALTDEEVMNPLDVEITDLHQTELLVKKDEYTAKEMCQRVKYMLECMNFKKRPSEMEYLERYFYKGE